ncbi:dihydrolipoyl dehydrogenase [Phosphitispora fastidiosa]|uniref:dihydrolipoyl dehydrogenase n=1 Tax=Phosphitispora fastidiosa TaxID=2837202 RepID=UPI001E331010|nr:dihydrolipoyl dehydrogenase [Phosphitispora fastidiosa]MBU7008244.1 dihydrolipoamide dehydrogenase [Phosphitispora fastidiosa]
MAYKIVILGGGPGGYVAAIRAAQLGAKVMVVEKDRLGGTCLNRGCIPTKALVSGTEVLRGLRNSREFGIDAGNPVIDFPRFMKRKDQVVQRLVTGINYLFKKHKIETVKGTGKLLSPNSVQIDKEDGSSEKVQAENIIIATGSRPAVNPSWGYDGTTVLTSDEILNLTECPKSLLIIGGGVIGCEFAGIFAELGAEVTIVEIMPSILSGIDKEAARLMQTLFKKQGITLKTGTGIQQVTKGQDGVAVTLETGEEIRADQMLVSVGRAFNTEGIGLDNVGVKTGLKGEIPVNSRMQTGVGNIYAIGDVTNKIQLAHVASAQGIAAVENIMGMETEMDYTVVPNCIFSYPEVASVGITGQMAEEQGIAAKAGKFPFMAVGRALAAGQAEGFVKIIADPVTDKILGVTIVGPHASDLIAEAALAVKLGATAAQLAGTIHAHPTLAEAVMEAAEAVHGRSIHI